MNFLVAGQSKVLGDVGGCTGFLHESKGIQGVSGGNHLFHVVTLSVIVCS